MSAILPISTTSSPLQTEPGSSSDPENPLISQVARNILSYDLRKGLFIGGGLLLSAVCLYGSIKVMNSNSLGSLQTILQIALICLAVAPPALMAYFYIADTFPRIR